MISPTLGRFSFCNLSPLPNRPLPLRPSWRARRNNRQDSRHLQDQIKNSRQPASSAIPPILSFTVSAAQHAAEVVEHARRGAPDIASLVGNRQVMAMPPAEAKLAALVARGVQEMLERRLEHARNLEGSGL